MERIRLGHHTRAAATALLLGAGFVVLAPGCAGSSQQPTPTAQRVKPVGRPPADERSAQAARDRAARSQASAAQTQRPAGAEQEQRAAQEAWCGYLQELYLRAAEGAGEWPRYQQCMEAQSMASPRMLRETAECSRRALANFQGDPFTVAYAAEVSRCGAEALDSAAATAPDLVPYMAAICGRVAQCEGIDAAECRQTLEEGLGPHLKRAVGAMNERGRGELRACFNALSCDDIGSQLNACIEPILDGLLWLPG